MRIRKKSIKIAVGILTFLIVIFPFIIMPAFFIFMMSGSGFPISVSPQLPPNPYNFDQIFPNIFLFLYPAVMCFSFGQLVLQVFYIVLVVKNKELTDTIRILFIVGMFFMPFIAMPIYFVAYFWNGSSTFLDDQRSTSNNTRSFERNIDTPKSRNTETTKPVLAKKVIRKSENRKTIAKKNTRRKS